MLILKIAAIFIVISFVGAENITFKNVTFHGYSVFTHKFKKVIVSSNNLKEEIPKAIFDAIEIKGQSVPILYENCIKDIDELDELILEEDGIEEIQPGAFKNLPRIRLVKMKDNQLKTIKSGVFNNLPVSDIDLSKNQISVIEDGAFDNMPSILNIRLTDNKIKKWNNNWFANTPLLTRVSLQNNLIEELPSEAFKNFVGVKKFGEVSLKINLMFSYNKIKILHPDTFKGIQEINNLWLDNNLIEKLPEKLFDGVSISHLKIDSNKLICIEEKETLLKAELNDIDGNPFECECLENMKKWGKENNITMFYFYSDMNCYAKRLETKMKDLEEYLKQMRKNNSEVEMVTNNSEVEMVTNKA